MQPGMVIPALGKQGEEEGLSSSAARTVQGDLVPRKQGPPGTLQTEETTTSKVSFPSTGNVFLTFTWRRDPEERRQSQEHETASKCMCFHFFFTCLFCFAVTRSPVVIGWPQTHYKYIAKNGLGDSCSSCLWSPTYWNYRWMQNNWLWFLFFPLFITVSLH